jgi:hypothetical protein
MIELAAVGREIGEIEQALAVCLHAARGADADARTETLFEPARRRQVIRVHVRFEDPVDTQTLALDEGDDLLRTPGARLPAHRIVVEDRIDDDGASRSRIGHDVGVRSRRLVEEGLDSNRHGARETRAGRRCAGS